MFTAAHITLMQVYPFPEPVFGPGESDAVRGSGPASRSATGATRCIWICSPSAPRCAVGCGPATRSPCPIWA